MLILVKTTGYCMRGMPWHINEDMSWIHFKAILTALTFTDAEPPEFVDRFWEIRQLQAWNKTCSTTLLLPGYPFWVNACQNGYP